MLMAQKHEGKCFLTQVYHNKKEGDKILCKDF